MFGRILLAVLVFGLCACSVTEQSPTQQRRALALKNRDFDNAVLKAQMLERMGEYKAARDEFLALFKQYKSEALLENAYMLTLVNEMDGIDEIDELSQPYLKSNAQLIRYSAVYHMQRREFITAETMLNNLNTWDTDFRNYELLGDLYLQKQNFKAALNNYQKSKANLPEMEELNEILTIKIAETQLIMKDQSAAKKSLEAYVEEGGCTYRVCLFLGKIYINENESEKLEALHIKLYELTKDASFIKVLIEGYVSEKRYDEALNLALKYDINEPEIVLFLYERNDKFSEAYEFALEIYEQKQDKKYLLIAAVMEFEDAMRNGKVAKSTLSSVSKKFEQGLDETSAALYLNYYGYLLIDYDLDVSKGINLVRQALRQEPNNLFYLDSLSWGYYKQGQCNDAWDVMLKTMHDKDFSNSDESKEHIKAIQKCLNNAKK